MRNPATSPSVAHILELCGQFTEEMERTPMDDFWRVLFDAEYGRLRIFMEHMGLCPVVSGLNLAGSIAMLANENPLMESIAAVRDMTGTEGALVSNLDAFLGGKRDVGELTQWASDAAERALDGDCSVPEGVEQLGADPTGHEIGMSLWIGGCAYPFVSMDEEDGDDRFNFLDISPSQAIYFLLEDIRELSGRAVGRRTDAEIRSEICFLGDFINSCDWEDRYGCADRPYDASLIARADKLPRGTRVEAVSFR